MFDSRDGIYSLFLNGGEDSVGISVSALDKEIDSWLQDASEITDEGKLRKAMSIRKLSRHGIASQFAKRCGIKGSSNSIVRLTRR